MLHKSTKKQHRSNSKHKPIKSNIIRSKLRVNNNRLIHHKSHLENHHKPTISFNNVTDFVTTKLTKEDNVITSKQSLLKVTSNTQSLVRNSLQFMAQLHAESIHNIRSGLDLLLCQNESILEKFRHEMDLHDNKIPVSFERIELNSQLLEQHSLYTSLYQQLWLQDVNQSFQTNFNNNLKHFQSILSPNEFQQFATNHSKSNHIGLPPSPHNKINTNDENDVFKILICGPESQHEHIPNNSNIIFYIHGGAFVMGDPLWVPYQNFIYDYASILNQQSNENDPTTQYYIISVPYPLAPQVQHPIPLFKLLSIYEYFINKTNPKQVFISGDSAGGNLTLSLSLALQHINNYSENVLNGKVEPIDPKLITQSQYLTSSSSSPSSLTSQTLNARQPNALITFSPITDCTSTSLSLSMFGLTFNLDDVLPAKAFGTCMSAYVGLCESYFPDQSSWIPQTISKFQSRSNYFTQFIARHIADYIHYIDNNNKNNNTDKQKQQENDLLNEFISIFPKLATRNEKTDILSINYQPFGSSYTPLPLHDAVIYKENDPIPYYYNQPLIPKESKSIDDAPYEHSLSTLTVADTVVNHYSTSPTRALKNQNNIDLTIHTPNTPILSKLPPLLITAGTREMLVNDAITFLENIATERDLNNNYWDNYETTNTSTSSKYQTNKLSTFNLNESMVYILPKSAHSNVEHGINTKQIPSIHEQNTLKQSYRISPFILSSKMEQELTPTSFDSTRFMVHWKAYSPFGPFHNVEQEYSNNNNNNNDSNSNSNSNTNKPIKVHNNFHHPLLSTAFSSQSINFDHVAETYLNFLSNQFFTTKIDQHEEESASTIKTTTTTQLLESTTRQHWNGMNYSNYTSIWSKFHIGVHPLDEESIHPLSTTISKGFIGTENPPIIISTPTDYSLNNNTFPSQCYIAPGMFHVFPLLSLLPQSVAAMSYVSKFIHGLTHLSNHNNNNNNNNNTNVNRINVTTNENIDIPKTIHH